MTKTSKTVLFFGNERLVTGLATEPMVLPALLAAGYDVAAIVSSYQSSASRGSRALEIQATAQLHNIPLLLPNKPEEISHQLADYGAAIGVLVAYGRIIPQDIINLFPHGIINLHPSLLPEHRGPTPIESTILLGQSVAGVSIMSLSAKMDAGPVYGQQKIKLDGHESKAELANRLHRLGSDMIIDLLPGILNGLLTPKPQNDAAASYDKLLTTSDGVIDWSKRAAVIEREIRAYAQWPKSRADLAGLEIIIIKAHVAPGDGQAPGTFGKLDKELVAYSGDGILVIDCLKPSGKQEMTGQAFLAGYSHLLRDN